MNRAKIAEEFFEDLKKLEGDNISLASLYGSVAEGTDNEDSDIDILIVVSKNKKDADNRAHGLVVKYLKGSGELISPIILSESEFQRNRALGTPYIKNVLAGRLLHGA